MGDTLLDEPMEKNAKNSTFSTVVWTFYLLYIEASEDHGVYVLDAYLTSMYRRPGLCAVPTDSMGG